LKDPQIKDAIQTDTSNEPEITNIPRFRERRKEKEKQWNIFKSLLDISIDGLPMEKSEFLLIVQILHKH